MNQSTGLGHLRASNDSIAKEREQVRKTVSDTQAWLDFTRLASYIGNCSGAYLSMVNAGQHRIVATVGTVSAETYLESDQCVQLLSRGQLLMTVEDRSISNDNQLGLPQEVAFFAGLPLQGQDGSVIGTLCLMDQHPRTLTAAQKEALLALARQAASRIDADNLMARLREKVDCFETCLNSSPAIVTIKDEAGNYRYANSSFLRLLGKQAQDVLGKTDAELWQFELASRFAEQDGSARKQGTFYSDAELIRRVDGSSRYWQVHRFTLRGSSLLACVGLDITEWKANEQQLMASQELLKRSLENLEVLSVTDGLTSLHNRRAFEEKLKEEFERARRYNLPLSLLMLDADRFKEFNDSCGHPAGDQLLREIALVLKNNARANDVPARYGGDEFAVILPNTDSKVAFHLAERLRRAAKMLCQDDRPVTVSVGVAALKPEMIDAQSLLVAADNALYDAKRKGRNRVSHTAGSLV